VPFAHLHVHSQRSVLDGTADVDDLVSAAKAHGFSALALTDTTNLYGAVAFTKACKSAGLHAVLGAELHVQPEGVAYADPRREAGGYQIVALVEDDAGYRNLCVLITDAIFSGVSYKPRVDLRQLAACRDGLIFLTGGLKGASGRVAQAGPDAARGVVSALADAVGAERLMLELVDHGVPGQDAVNQLQRGLATSLGLPTVVTNAVHMVRPEDVGVLDVLHAIGSGGSMAVDGRVAVASDQAWLKPEREMRALFPDDASAIDLAGAVAERCSYKMQLGVYRFPATTPPDAPSEGGQPPDTDANWAYFYRAFPPPRLFGLPGPGDAVPPRPADAGHLVGYFGWYARRGLDLRLQRVPADAHAAYRERLESEIQMIAQMGFPAYLLIVAEFINWSKDQGIPVGPGRGSAAGSLVAWALRITDIDPIRFGLLFERFLNPERVSMPDIDVDFCQDRREEAIDHVRTQYGADLVSQIITFGTFKARAAVRDVARVLDLSFNDADRLAKLIPDGFGVTLEDALQQEPRLVALAEGDPRVRRVLALAQAIEGNVRQTGVHAAGVVIADRPLVEIAPLYRDDRGGGPVVQFDMKSAEAAGLVKFDFLGLKTLDQVRDALALIERNHGVALDLADLPDEDEQTMQLLARGESLGVFQLESQGMRELLTRLRPNHVEDMVALVALYRPGPLQSGMVEDFVDRKHGLKPVSYPHPALEPILQGTYGTIIYQEQVMQIAQVLAGYSLGEADLLRRAMGKKDPAEMEGQRVRFVGGAVARGVGEALAREIFELLFQFASYGFNKSHSAAYGMIAYQTAWLKAHYRAEFMASLMTIEAADADKVLQYVLDARRAGIVVEPVCLNESQRHFAVPPVRDRPVDADGRPRDSIRFGLAAVKAVGEGAVDALLDGRRAAGGRFATATDAFERLDFRKVNKRVVEALVKAGAFDFSGVSRASMWASLESAMSYGQQVQSDRASGQIGLFAAMGSRAGSLRFPEVPEWSTGQRLAGEREVLGLYLSGHPMEAHARDRSRLKAATLQQVGVVEDEVDIRALGLVADIRTARTRSGDRMAFVRIEDETRSLECTFFSEAWARSQRALESGEPVVVSGRIERTDDVRILASSVETLSAARATWAREIRISLPIGVAAGEHLGALKAALEAHRGATPAVLELSEGSYTVELRLPALDAHQDLDAELSSTFGVASCVEWS
jgi:DNA polymerase-3 subunit alpha